MFEIELCSWETADMLYSWVGNTHLNTRNSFHDGRFTVSDMANGTNVDSGLILT